MRVYCLVGYGCLKTRLSHSCNLALWVVKKIPRIFLGKIILRLWAFGYKFVMNEKAKRRILRDVRVYSDKADRQRGSDRETGIREVDGCEGCTSGTRAE